MEIQHPSHEHPLTLCDDDSDLPPPGSFECEGCDQPITHPTYTCSSVSCKFYLHKSCAYLTLQAQIHHPLHPLHPLTLNFDNAFPPFRLGLGWPCNCCREIVRISSYLCQKCEYLLCVECASLNRSPVLKLRNPDHLLLLLQKVEFSNDVRCSVCCDGFGGEHSNSPVLLCIIPDCYYALHFHCSPLRIPKVVRHKYHNFHDLIYTEDVIDYGYSEGDNYCDACEETRNPRFPVYACKENECEFAAHVHCGVAEMLPSLVEEYENDLLERGVSLDAFPPYFERRITEVRADIDELEAQLKTCEEKIEALMNSLLD